ncbi:LIM domain-binding protein 2-like isoform X2 [Babylonia areolata]|uniref:LIM domain-binding protein 2-like isoform X2 n=1 Tax=Babylonia areolata TaxID=304850 RepID=UPI003FD4001B
MNNMNPMPPGMPPMNNMPPMNPPPPGHGGPGDPFFTSPFSPFYRRPAPPSFMGQQQPDYRIHELNKRLQQRNEESDNLWWDAFATEFFEDDASLTLTFCLEDGPKRYTIGRTLIPRYFRSIFEGGVTDLHYVLRHTKESFHNTTISLDCDQASMVTQHGKPMFPYVITEGRLLLEFTFDDLMRIRSWHFAIRQHRELIPRTVIGMQPVDPAMMEQMSKNITRQGLTNYTLNFLRLCVILEPMQELMSRHKAYGLNPRDCLKTTLFQKWQRMVAPVGKESARPPSKRRKRKGSASNNSGAGNNNRDVPPSGKQKRSPGPHGFNLGSSVPGAEKTTKSKKKKKKTEELTENSEALHCNGLDPVLPVDVMVVGEPTLMGGEFGDEDERLITRLENTQFEGTGVGGPDPDEGGGVVEKKFSNSPAWGGQGDKKTPPISSSAAGPPPPPTGNPETEIKTE